MGSYYCWNRVYDIYFGRWTTPDPAASPWWNLWDYCGNGPLQRTDPIGLAAKDEIKATKLEGTSYSEEKEPCEGTWKFDEFKQGMWDQEDANGDPETWIGVVAKLTFTLGDECKCNCDEIRLLQVSRSSTRVAGDKDFKYNTGTLVVQHD